MGIWPFKKRKKDNLAEIFSGFTDYHSHILPGVDDGVQTMEESLKILQKYEEWGVSAVWCTPHIMEDYPNTTAALRERFAELQAAYDGPVKLNLAAENMMDNLFEERLATGDVLPFGPKGDHLLVETSYFNPPLDLYGILDRVRAKGFFPILAHPERYAYMDMKDYERLKSLGVKFQMNLFSQTGAYGRTAQKKALDFMDKYWYNMCGTDIHRIAMLEHKWGQLRLPMM
jgi:tyrosine-protein phosphatase YwqE